MTTPDSRRQKLGLTAMQLQMLRHAAAGSIVKDRQGWWRLHRDMRFAVAHKTMTSLRHRDLVALAGTWDDGRAVLMPLGQQALAFIEGRAAA